MRSPFNLVPQSVLFQNFYLLRMRCKCNHCSGIKKKKKIMYIGSFPFYGQKNWVTDELKLFVIDLIVNQLQTRKQLRMSYALDKNSCLQSRLSLCSSYELLHCFLMCHVPSSTCSSRLLEAWGHCVTTQCQNVTIISAGWW